MSSKLVALCISIACILAANATLSIDLPLSDHQSSNGLTGSLGAGYDTVHDVYTGQDCLLLGDIKPIDGTGNYGSVALSNSKQLKEIEREMNVELSAKGGYGRFSASASSSFLRYTKETSYSQSFFFSEILRFPTREVKPAHPGVEGLSEFGKYYYDEGGDQFLESCGDSFIGQEVTGARFVVASKVVFRTSFEKTRFAASMSASYAFASFSSALRKSSSELNLKGSVEIILYQEGGDATQLPKVFSKDESGHFYVVTCSLDKLEKCDGIFNGVLEYATNNFPDQIDYDEGSVGLGKSIRVEVTPLPYKKFGIQIPKVKPIPIEARLVRNELTDMYDETLDNLQRVHHILHSQYAGSLEAAPAERLAAAEAVLNRNFATIRTEAIPCYEDSDTCAGVLEYVREALDPVDDEILKQFRYGWEMSTYLLSPLGSDRYHSEKHDGSSPGIAYLEFVDGGQRVVGNLGGYPFEFIKKNDEIYEGWYKGSAKHEAILHRILNPM